jgi:hypothetical protein
MMKIKPRQRPEGATHEKSKGALARPKPRRLGEERPQRIWSLLLPPGFERR